MLRSADEQGSDSRAGAPTMADVAAHVGVSRQLVSIVLRDMPGASQGTRERVLQAAAELGYSPHLGARTLRQSRSRQIGVAFAPAHATEPEIVEVVYAAAAEHGYRIVLSAQTATRTVEHALEELLGYRCAAIVLISPELPDVQLKALAARVKVPLIALAAGESTEVFDVVRSSGDVGIALAVEHLVALGHDTVAYVHTPAMPPAATRLAGYTRAADAAGLSPDVMVLAGDDYTEEAGAAAARQLLARRQLPTAVVTGNDQQAVGMIHVLSRAGVRIPEDLSLTGFDDSRLARLSSVDLTTVRQDPVLMGKAAVAAAVRRIGRPTVSPSLFVVDVSLVVRGSTAPPRDVRGH